MHSLICPLDEFHHPPLRALLLDFLLIYYVVCNLLCVPVLNHATVSVTQRPHHFDKTRDHETELPPPGWEITMG